MPDQPGAGAPTSGEGGEARTFTQDDLDRVATREKAQGKRAAQRELLEQAGFESVEEYTAFVEAARKREEEALTEQQRREQEIAQREAAAAERERKAAERLAEANRRAALVTLGATGDNLTDALALLGANVGSDADDDAIAEAAAALQERRPELFTAPSTERAPAPDSRLRGAPRNPAPPTVKPGARGLSEAQRRYGNRTASQTA